MLQIHVLLQDSRCYGVETTKRTRTYRLFISVNSFAKRVWPITIGLFQVGRLGGSVLDGGLKGSVLEGRLEGGVLEGKLEG